MATSTVVERLALAALYIHCIYVALDGISLVGGDDDTLVLGVESAEVLNHKIALGQLAYCARTYIIYIQVVVAILLTLHDKLLAVPRQEDDGVHRLHVFVALLAIQLLQLIARGGIIAHELAVVLQSVELEHIHRLAVRTPCYVGEIAVGGVAGFEILNISVGAVIYAHSHLVACHSEHRIFVRLVCSHSLEGVHLRIVGHHALVHPVEGKPVTVGSPEDTLFDTKLIAMYRLSIHYLA